MTTSETVTLGDIAVGDHVTIVGSTSGSDVTAERIVDSGTEAAAGFGGGRGQPPADGQGAPSGQTPPTDQSGNPVTPPSGGQFPGQGQNGGGRGGFVRGQVTAVDGSTLTVTGQDGTTYTVTASSTTTVTKTKTGSLSDLAVGDEVSVMGATGSDGTVAATRISEGALGGGFGGGQFPGGRGQGGTSPTTTN